MGPGSSPGRRGGSGASLPVGGSGASNPRRPSGPGSPARDVVHSTAEGAERRATTLPYALRRSGRPAPRARRLVVRTATALLFRTKTSLRTAGPKPYGATQAQPRRSAGRADSAPGEPDAAVRRPGTGGSGSLPAAGAAPSPHDQPVPIMPSVTGKDIRKKAHSLIECNFFPKACGSYVRRENHDIPALRILSNATSQVQQDDPRRSLGSYSPSSRDGYRYRHYKGRSSEQSDISLREKRNVSLQFYRG